VNIRGFSLFFAAVLAQACVGDTSDENIGSEVQDAKQRIACGGFAGLPCPSGFVCVDQPGDGCNTQQGDADCMGYCKKTHGQGQCGNDPAKSYISTDPAQCAALSFLCAQGSVPFFDDCGCGCEFVGEPCGSAVCGAGEYCCNASCSMCAPEGNFCIQIACEPA
jgi:hypothetical protein